MFNDLGLRQNHIRFRVTPDDLIALGVNISAVAEGLLGQSVEIVGSRHPSGEEIDAYERVLGDAMAGDATLFAREDYVEEAWRIVDPVLEAGIPVGIYEPGTWGPKEVEGVTPAGGWQNPS